LLGLGAADLGQPGPFAAEPQNGTMTATVARPAGKAVLIDLGGVLRRPWHRGPWQWGPWQWGPWQWGPWQWGPWQWGPWQWGPWQWGPWQWGPWQWGPWHR